jgi:hypothetical protein
MTVEKISKFYQQQSVGALEERYPHILSFLALFLPLISIFIKNKIKLTTQFTTSMKLR